MLRKIVICLWILSCASLCVAQGRDKNYAGQSRPDLGGTWVLDKKKSDLSWFDRDLMKGGLTLTVHYSEPEIKITYQFRLEGKDRTQEMVYYTDGRGEKNSSLVSKAVAESITLWDGNKLVSKSVSRRRTSRGIFELETWQKWELSADGRRLTQTITYGNASVNPGGRAPVLFAPPPQKRVFNRVP